ncbi:MAG: hypothetical protein MUF24_02655 [Chitinophagaceae bacterium]|nr:hypothetical protein [Chitinophagaceae bacterium]
MFDLYYDNQKRLLGISLANTNLYEVAGWLLHSDGTLAQKLNLISSLQVDCRHLQPGHWFIKIEMPRYTGLKKFTISANTTEPVMAP